MPINMDGKMLSLKVRENIKIEVESIKSSTGKTPGLAVILVGNNPASQAYVGSKKKMTTEVGMNSYSHELPEDVSKEDVLNLIKELNADDSVNGILVQLPLPKHINEQDIINVIDPDKDVDGFHPYNLGKLLRGEETLIPCTPYGITKFFEEYEIDTKGKNLVVMGRSNIVGKPIANLMMQKGEFANSTVTVVHTGTKNVEAITKKADIIVVATGYPNTLTGEMVKDDVVVVDVGINRVEDASRERGYRLIGDVDYDTVAPKSSYITPVPGGVGPMTIAMLLSNTLKAFKMTNGIK